MDLYLAATFCRCAVADCTDDGAAAATDGEDEAAASRVANCSGRDDGGGAAAAAMIGAMAARIIIRLGAFPRSPLPPRLLLLLFLLLLLLLLSPERPTALKEDRRDAPNADIPVLVLVLLLAAAV